MKNRQLAEQWLGRAKSNLSRAKLGKENPEIFYEDLCFDCQQAGEKSLKAFMILQGIIPSPTHSLSVLIETLEVHDISVPESLKAAVALSYYAVTTRYPGHYEPIEDREYQSALKMAEQIVEWVEEQF
ncbi:MAG: HEPN domain-containing protein [Methanoregula sp.]|jgi:HEPN domain-containing protein